MFSRIIAIFMGFIICTAANSQDNQPIVVHNTSAEKVDVIIIGKSKSNNRYEKTCFTGSVAPGASLPYKPSGVCATEDNLFIRWKFFTDRYVQCSSKSTIVEITPKGACRTLERQYY